MPGGPTSEDHGVVGAVVTAFGSGTSLVTACTSLADQTDLVVVVDDGSPDPDEHVLALCAATGAVIVRHRTNRGVAAALNTGVAELRERLGGRMTHVITLDQDSVLPPGYVAALLAAEREARATGLRVAMTGPGAAGRVRPAASGGDGVVLSREPIQSGLLVRIDALDEIGPFAEELFIDGVDTDLYLRALSLGMVAVAAPEVRLDHALGSVHRTAVAGSRGIVHAAPFRYYYIARNRVHLVRRHGRRAARWAVGAVLRDVRHLAVVTLLVPGRVERLRQTAAGLRDGLHGRVGRRGAEGGPAA